MSSIAAGSSDQKTDQSLLSHIIRSLASPAGEHGGRNVSGLLQEPQDTLNDGTSVGNSEVVSALLSNGQGPPRPFRQHLSEPVSEMPQPGFRVHNASGGEVQEHNNAQAKVNTFDLNDTYIDSDDGTDDVERSPVPANLGTNSLDYPSWMQQNSQQSSPPQTSGNSNSASAQSPSSSSGDAQVKLLGHIIYS